MTKEKLTPKYWAVYDHNQCDVLVWTLSKASSEVSTIMDETFLGDWREDPKFEVILVEIVRVEI